MYLKCERCRIEGKHLQLVGIYRDEVLSFIGVCTLCYKEMKGAEWRRNFLENA